MRFAFILEEKAWPKATMCRVLQVSSAGYYAWQRRPASNHAKDDDRLKVLIGASFDESRKTYGSPRVLKDLTEGGERVGRNRVIRLMQEGKLVARVKRRYRSTTMSEHDQPIAPNLLDRKFEAEAPNQRWVGDTTELLKRQVLPRGDRRPLRSAGGRLGGQCCQRQPADHGRTSGGDPTPVS